MDSSGFRPSCPKLFGCAGSREKPLGQWPFRSQASSWKQRGITVDTGNPPPVIPICRLMYCVYMYSLCSYRLHRFHTWLVRDYKQSTVAARLVKDRGRDTTLKACFSVESYTGPAGLFKTSCGFEYHHFIQCSSIFSIYFSNAWLYFSHLS